VQALGLADWVDELEHCNNAFEDTVLERNKEKSVKPALNVRDIRRKIDTVYLQIIERIEAQILINGEAKFAEFVNNLNSNITRYAAIISRRGKKSMNNEQ